MIRSTFYLLVHSLSYLSTSAQPGPSNKVQAVDSLYRHIHLSATSFAKENKILLQWKSTVTGKNSYYIIERSTDKNVFELIGAMRAPDNRSYFEFLDERPLAAQNYYRIKMQAEEQNDIYSQVITSSIEGSIFCKFYPNPVDKLLILRAEHRVDIRISDASGQVLILQYLQPGLQIVDVSCLAKGMYIITVFQRDSNGIIIRKLMKN